MACGHAYHSWCEATHFRTFSRCMQKGCDKIPHEDWWRLSRIKLVLEGGHHGGAIKDLQTPFQQGKILLHLHVQSL